MKKVLFMVMLAVFVTPMMGCKEKGPMETAGEKIDQAAKDTKDATKDAYKNTTNRIDRATK
jgi:predicted small lipoprotein YifL